MAFAHRGRRIMVDVAAMYENLEEAPLPQAWAADLGRALHLAAIKRRYDPANLFRLNQNVEPEPE